MSIDEKVYDICIIGGGIGGLATALALANRGWQDRIILCERDMEIADRKQGYGLTLTNSPLGPLARLGILNECIAKNCVSHSHYTFNAQGEILGYYGRVIRHALEAGEKAEKAQAEGIEQGGNRGNLRIPRQEMRQMMITKLQSLNVRLQWGWKLIDFHETEDDVMVNFSDQQVKNNPVQQGNEVIKQVRCRVLVGSDGLRSKVRELRDLKYIPTTLQSPLQYIGISVMIGISPISHPLLEKKGFYVLDGTNRLFLMPYFHPKENAYQISELIQNGLQYHDEEGSEGDSNITADTPLIMWQLSFSGMKEEEALSLKGSSFDTIYNAALKRVEHMFPAVQGLIRNTKYTREIWATPLYDREDMFPYRKEGNGGDQPKKGGTPSYTGRVTVLGDACHPMSMFKGQGANMALEDSVLFAAYISSGMNQFQEDKKRKHSDLAASSSNPKQQLKSTIGLDGIQKSTINTRLRNFEREMIYRASSKVKGSRESSQKFHSVEALDEKIGITGLPQDDELLSQVLQSLKTQGINASCGEELDDKFQHVVLEEMKAFQAKSSM